jgi:hypothetical protein
MSPATRSVRLRRTVAAFIAAVALVFGGSIAISPAYAAVGDIQINDANGSVGAGVQMTVYSTTNATSVFLTTDASGLINLSAQPDDVYYVWPTDTVVYDATNSLTTVTVSGGAADYSVITLIRNQRVYGSIPDDAGSSNTTIELWEFNGSSWVDTGTSTVVTSATGDFSIPLPGPSIYSLHFT